jgi:hypothetical protein
MSILINKTYDVELISKMRTMFTSISIILKKDFKYIQTVVKSFESIRNHPSPSSIQTMVIVLQN